MAKKAKFKKVYKYLYIPGLSRTPMVQRVGCEYRLLDEIPGHPRNQLLIGYVDSKDTVQVVRWVPGIFMEDH